MDFIQIVDSLLNTRSDISKKMDEMYAPPEQGTFLGRLFGAGENHVRYSNVSGTIQKVSKRLDKTLGKKGFSTSYRQMNDKTYCDVHYGPRFVGYYEINMNEPVADNIEKKKALLSNNMASGVDTRLGSSTPVFSQMKDLYRNDNKGEAKGNISISGNASTGQEEYSKSDNNYYEVAGKLEIPVMGIPVSVNGYYTSQDQNRIAKASYLNLHYDSEKAKSELLKLIGGYKSKYGEAVSKSNGMGKIYGTYLNSLQSEKDKLWTEISSETGITDKAKFGVDTAGLLKELAKPYQKSSSELSDTKGKLNGVTNNATAPKEAVEKYNSAMRKYRRLQQLEKKVEYYSTLLRQCNNNNYFDSVIAYDNLKKVTDENVDGKSYKQLAKSAKGFLPDDKYKSFVSGLNSFDIGIFSKQVSSYTLNGQMIKGVDADYDLNLFSGGLTYGRVEYVDRDGQVDKYTTYSGRATFKPANMQTATIVYYGYTPSKRTVNENQFFDGVNSYMPSFQDPIHIVSVLYNAAINKHMRVEGEAASSFRNFDDYKKAEVPINNRMAYNVAIEGTIPKTYIDVRTGYEHIGRQFENNTLPVNMAGTQKYVAGAEGQFFNNFLSLGVEYNHLLQQNFASQSANSKWGFNIKTTSKRYPSASLSYKPFTTVRSYSDTLNIPQRPLLGEVWLGKLTYQIKKKEYVLRFTAIYNKNTSLVDTMRSANNVIQFNAIYTKAKASYMMNAGQTHVDASGISVLNGKTNFLTLAASYVINKQWNVNVGQDVGESRGLLSRYAFNLGGGYRFKKVPLSIRSNFRYNTYRVSEVQAWKTIYSCMLNMNWEFRFKMKEKE
ncbi:MAG: hypothetical protein JST70_05415 [Bacteroidetes bacterium]|nr:hypothetical protein [Bacteroidota bacterium]